MAVTLVLALFAESQTSGVHQNEAMGVVFVTSVSMIFTFFVFLVSLFNLPNTLVIIGTRKEAYLSYTVSYWPKNKHLFFPLTVTFITIAGKKNPLLLGPDHSRKPLCNVQLRNQTDCCKYNIGKH